MVTTGDKSQKGLEPLNIKFTNKVCNGQKYKIDFYKWDVRTDPKVAVSGALKMMDEANIRIMSGPMYSAATIACQSVTQPRGVIHMVISGAPTLLRKGITHTFTTAPHSALSPNSNADSKL